MAEAFGFQDANEDLNKLLESFAGRLPNAEQGKVVTRFPPEPSGYLHIGHAKAALLNNFYARYFKGKMLLRFDDTNPTKEKMEFEQSIIEDLKLLEIAADSVSHTSDHFERILETCTSLLQSGKFYVDDTPMEKMREERQKCIESVCRENSIERNLQLWEEMKKGSEEGLKCCVRARINMKDKNGCLRDPVMYRCNLTPHHYTGDKYKVYPTYDFACPLVDSWEGVTHALRTNEYADRIPQYKWVQDAVDCRRVTIYEFARLNFVNTVLSKRKLQWLVDTGVVEGWDDPRFPTVRGIIRRGLTVQALYQFLIEQGPSKNVTLMEWDKLWKINKQLLDNTSPRYMGVAADGVSVSLDGAVEPYEKSSKSLHPKNADLGECANYLSGRMMLEKEDADSIAMGEEVTLMRYGNAIIEARDESGLKGRLNLEGDFKKTKKKLHWVIDTSRIEDCDLRLVPAILREYAHIITKKKPEENDTMDTIVNRDSVFDTPMLCEPALRDAKVGTVFQLERRGLVRVDKILDDNTLILIKIPDGKIKAMSTLSTKVDSQALSKGGATSPSVITTNSVSPPSTNSP